jgi:hypothetical protein
VAQRSATAPPARGRPLENAAWPVAIEIPFVQVRGRVVERAREFERMRESDCVVEARLALVGDENAGQH